VPTFLTCYDPVGYRNSYAEVRARGVSPASRREGLDGGGQSYWFGIVGGKQKTSHQIVIAILLVTILFTAESHAANYVRVGSFNIANFGSSENGEYERSLVSLVNIILKMDADVIALQEIEPTELGTEQVERFTKLVNKAASYYEKPAYDYVIAEEYTGDETVAYLWRDPVTLESEITLLEHDHDPADDGVRTFQRVPHYALFSAANYAFYLVNCHLYTTLPSGAAEGRGDEFDAIVEWLKDLAGETAGNAKSR